MIAERPKIIMLMCNNCKGMTEKLLPKMQLQYSEVLRILPVSCPSQLDPFIYIKLLKNNCDGVIVACTKDACCCPGNKKVLKRREIVKDLLPVFGFNREQFQIASVSPLGSNELAGVIEHMLTFLELTEKRFNDYKYIQEDEILGRSYKWVN